MKHLFKIASIAAIFVFFGFPTASAQGQDGITRRILDNGVAVILEESHKAPVVAIEALIRTGSAQETGYLGSGISHFVEHLIFKGTGKWPAPGQIERQIKSIGGYINAFTSHDSTGVYIIIPSDRVNTALEILQDIMTGSLFDQEELEKEREVILKEIRLNRDDPGRYLSQLMWSTMFRSHYYRFPVIGYEGLLKGLKREDLINYYRARYIPDNMVLAISGDIDSGSALKKVEDTFGAIKRVSPPAVLSPVEPPQIIPIEISENKKLAVSYLVMGFHSVALTDKDLFGLDVLSLILGGGEGSRLFKSLYREKRLVYSVGSYNHTPRDPGIFMVSAVLKKENIDTAISGIWQQIEDLKKIPVDEKELEKAKNQVVSAYIFSKQTVQERAGDLASGEALIGDHDFSKKYVEGIKAVTKEAVREAANKYLKRDSATVIQLVPEEEKEKPARQASRFAAPEISRIELKNGLKVLLLEDHSAPIASFSIIGLGGLRTEDFNNNGISNLVSDMLTCGTGSRTEDRISSEIEGLGASLDSYSGANTFGIRAACLSKDADTVLDVLSDVAQDPQFPQDKILREKTAIEGGIRSIDDDIYSLGMRTMKYVLFRNHPYRFQAMGRIPSVSALSRKDLTGYFRAYYVPGNMVISIAGDIDKQAMKEKISKIFGRLKMLPSPEINPPAEKKHRQPRFLKRPVEKEQSLILLGYPGTTVRGHDKYVLDVLSSVLSGIDGRLSQKIREQLGLAYALNVESVAGIEPGMIIFYVGTTRKNIETAKRALFGEIGSLKKDGVNDRELASAKSQLIGLHKIGLQRPQDIAAQAAIGELYGLGYDNFLKYEGRISRISKECVQRAAKKYLNNNSFVLLTIEGTE